MFYETAIAAMMSEEALVSDVRAALTPSQMVDTKLVLLLRGLPQPVSQMQTPRPRWAHSENSR